MKQSDCLQNPLTRETSVTGIYNLYMFRNKHGVKSSMPGCIIRRATEIFIVWIKHKYSITVFKLKI